MLTLSCREITKTYDGTPILQGCSIRLETPGIYVLTGPNGSGKSTFLRICALLEQPDSGEISYLSDALEAQNDIALRRRITLLLPKVGVFNTTVFRNAAYGLHLRKADRGTIRDRVGKALAFVGLSEKADQHARSLSSGETQRLGIARALVIDPEVFFLDEPTASVDAKNTAIIEGILQKLRTRSRIVVITTHDLEQAQRLADQMLRMKDGRIVKG